MLESLRREPDRRRYPAVVRWWLVLGLFMIFVQVVVGGITRLTGSGLSITEWDIVFGSIPPLNDQAWEEAFDAYKVTPQYQKVTAGMSMSDFKFIYFWEYIHRLWARLMGFVFLLPLIYFVWKGYIDRWLTKRLLVVFLLAALVASLGWIMVASGLINRPWVNAYKLTLHLSVALLLFGYLWWTILGAWELDRRPADHRPVLRASGWLMGLLIVQLVLGGIVSGSHAALAYPTWPDMNGQLVPAVLFDTSQWHVDNFVQYDSSPFLPALVQTLHRWVAYTLFILGIWIGWRGRRQSSLQRDRTAYLLLISMLIAQVLLGVFTLLNSVGSIPVGLGVMHQAGALILLTIVLLLRYVQREEDTVVKKLET